jgi:hypothetical protein
VGVPGVKKHGSAVAVHKETEEFFGCCPACISFFEFFQGDGVFAAGVVLIMNAA